MATVVCLGTAASLVLCAAPARAQISPGLLSRPHSFLNGDTNCTSCHRLGGQATFKCLECHTEIGSRIAAGRGFHARIVAKEAGSQSCAGCHSEHNGEEFAIIKWAPSQQQFDHGKTGWALTGKHAALSCNRCHTPANIVTGEKPLIKVKDLSRTYLGLSSDCAGCHKDPHLGQLGRTCEQCHSTNDWKALAGFNHARTRFALTGGHARVACQKCHTPTEPGGVPRWKGLAFDRCTACHADRHRGTFVNSCQSCHSTVTWKSVPATTLAGKFDHATTKYPLRGKHALLGCEQCHAAGDFKKPIAFQQCSDCHRPDPHSGQFAQRADAGECSSCHTVEGFKPAKFGLADHNKTYPLQGKHASVGCEKCHLPAGKATLYRLKFAQCTDCHRDVHERQFATAPILNRCESCHSLQEFRPSTFTQARHQSSRFPLSGGHVAVACSDCHRPLGGPGLERVARYRFEDRSCTTCHRDPHRGQFAERMRMVAGNGKPAGCQACHSLASWKELAGFDHASTEFALLGAHRAVACADCHRPPNLETTLADVNFGVAPRTCEGCHRSPHGGQFVVAGVAEQCASCHNSNKWKPSLFDHNTRTRFPLEGVHKNVRCARCHSSTRLVDGDEVLFYKPTPRECAACHGPAVTPTSATAARR
ncbi:MAG: hypothetical protein LAN64_11045 [Acidobacteriia bacterium]|nr:hypothetical protein [Terriglobia bacterium]